MKSILLNLLFILCLFPLAAQEGETVPGTDSGSLPEETVDEPIIDEDALFGGTETAIDEEALFGEEGAPLDEVPTIEESDASFEDAFLVSEAVTIGGKINVSLGTTFFWYEYPDSGDYLLNSWKENFLPRLAASLFFDARPVKNFRVFGKVKTDLPLTNSTIVTDATSMEDITISTPNIEIFELYSDFSRDEVLFFRVGKHTVNWGVGYFWSPADIINLSPIDIEDPEAQREGPVSIKMNVPIDIHNLDFYVIAGNNIESITEIGLAARGEVVIGNFELGAGIGYQKDMPPKGILTFTGPIWDMDIFGEGCISYGSDKNFVETDSSIIYSVTTREEDWFFSGTIGAMYTNADWHLSIFGQYFFNHEGYKEANTLSDLYKTATGTPSVDPSYLSAVAALPELNMEDFLNPGMHYAAVNISWYDIGDSGFGISTLWHGNLCDISGLVSTNFSYELFDRFNISAGIHAAYGEEGDEYIGNKTPDDQYLSFINPYGRLAFSISASLGGGSF
jgi:hypothetical protein